MPQEAGPMQALSGTSDLALGWYAVRMGPMEDPQIATGHFINFGLDPRDRTDLVGRVVTVELRQNYVDESDKGIFITSTTVVMPDEAKEFSYAVPMEHAVHIRDYSDLTIRAELGT